MYQQYLLRTKKNRVVASGITFVLTFIVTAAIALVSMQNNNQKNIEREAHHLQNILDSFINDAHSATQQAAGLIGKVCDFTVEKELNMIPGRYMHIYSINIVNNKHISCSSLLANKHADVQHIISSGERIWMSQAVSSPDIEVISFKTSLPQGDVYVASDIRYLLDVLRGSTSGRQLALEVSGKTLTAAGLSATPLSSPHFSGYTVYPANSSLYTLAWEQPRPGKAVNAMARSWISISFILAMSLIMASVVWLLATRRHSLYTQLANAIRLHQIHPHYQPLICAHTNIISGAEILARWNHEELGFVPPDVFIPVAERTALIIDLTESLLEQVVDDLQQGVIALAPGFNLNLNISYSHLADDAFDAFVDNWAPVFAALGVTLVFEITERENIDISEAMARKITHIKTRGIKIALDDFGTGFSNLAFISNLRPDSIKIDRMFVRQISLDVATPLIDCVIDMAKRMNILTTAEGVEYDYQVEYLKANQIDCLQGYYFSKPLAFGDFAMFLRSYAVR
ncbi:diguanylate cyclase-phosphodiesterase (GGDEF & EAL domains) with PAS-PAC sensor(s) [Lelliottia jeotgali]|nr:diguanylate cyclase-phosphodiesterase (GGDEF & EAL domains) with PAS-PAC sensor(s) [Lelliottia jeotgali]